MKQEQLKEIEQLIYDKRTNGAFIITAREDGHGGTAVFCDNSNALISSMIAIAVKEPQIRQIFSIVNDALALYERKNNGQEN